jgi:hypothetical protein
LPAQISYTTGNALIAAKTPSSIHQPWSSSVLPRSVIVFDFLESDIANCSAACEHPHHSIQIRLEHTVTSETSLILRAIAISLVDSDEDDSEFTTVTGNGIQDNIAGTTAVGASAPVIGISKAMVVNSQIPT